MSACGYVHVCSVLDADWMPGWKRKREEPESKWRWRGYLHVCTIICTAPSLSLCSFLNTFAANEHVRHEMLPLLLSFHDVCAVVRECVCVHITASVNSLRYCTKPLQSSRVESNRVLCTVTQTVDDESEQASEHGTIQLTFSLVFQKPLLYICALSGGKSSVTHGGVTLL